MDKSSILINQALLSEFCQKWSIQEVWLFGSALRGDFSAESDIDLMVRFAPNRRLSLLDLIGAEQELSDLLGRPVDLMMKEDVERSENYIRRNEILRTARPIFLAESHAPVCFARE